MKTYRSIKFGLRKTRLREVLASPRGVPFTIWDVDALPGVAYGGGPLLRAASQSNGRGADNDGEEGKLSGDEYIIALSLDLREDLIEGGVAAGVEGEGTAKVLERGAGPGNRERRRLCAAGVAYAIPRKQSECHSVNKDT